MVVGERGHDSRPAPKPGEPPVPGPDLKPSAEDVSMFAAPREGAIQLKCHRPDNLTQVPVVAG